jgi:hypothetical protein
MQPKSEGKGDCEMLVTPEAIRTLQRKLYTKAKQEPAYRFYALYDKVWRADILRHAYRLVRANKGSPGIDGIDFEDIEQKIGIDTFLSELAQDLKGKTYRAQPVRRVMIPKADGSMRPLGIPTVPADYPTRQHQFGYCEDTTSISSLAWPNVRSSQAASRRRRADADPAKPR